MPGTARLLGRPVYYCEVCGLAYKDETLAQRCEEHCRTHPSCSLELSRQAVGSVNIPPKSKRDDRTVG